MPKLLLTCPIGRTARELAIVAAAHRWAAHVFAGREIRVECATEAEARAAAQVLADEHCKPTLVYAIAGQASAVVVSVGPRSEPGCHPPWLETTFT